MVKLATWYQFEINMQRHHQKTVPCVESQTVLRLSESMYISTSQTVVLALLGGVGNLLIRGTIYRN